MSAKKETPEKYNKILESCEPNCKGKYCFYRKFMETQHTNIYTIVQVKLIEKMKWIWGVEKPEITWQEATMRWTPVEPIEEMNYSLASAYRIAFDEFSEKDMVNFDGFIDMIFSRTIEIHKVLQELKAKQLTKKV